MSSWFGGIGLVDANPCAFFFEVKRVTDECLRSALWWNGWFLDLSFGFLFYFSG